MQEQAKTPKKKRGWLWLLVGVLAFAVLTTPVIRGCSLQSRAGKLIRAYVNDLETSEINPTKGNFYCLLPSFYEMPKSEDLGQAIVWLIEAKSIAPRNVYNSFLLGQAYCLKQEYQKAVDAMDLFLTSRRDNQLAKAESGFASFALAQSMSDPQRAQTYRSKSLQSLEIAGFSTNSFINLGDASFKREKYQDTLVWYGLSDSLSGLQQPTLFRYLLLQLVFQGSSPFADQIKDSMLLELDEELTIEFTDLFELSTGAAMQTSNEDNKTIAILPSNSQEASMLLNVVEANRFCISLLALDKPPQPTQIGVDVDLKTFTTVELVNGDGEWVQFDFEVDLDQGFHILAVKLMNDLYIAGEIDRNAYIGPVTIKACQEE